MASAPRDKDQDLFVTLGMQSANMCPMFAQPTAPLPATRRDEPPRQAKVSLEKTVDSPKIQQELIGAECRYDSRWLTNLNYLKEMNDQILIMFESRWLKWTESYKDRFSTSRTNLCLWSIYVQPCLRGFLRRLVSTDNWNNTGQIGHLLQGVNQRLTASWEYEPLDLRLRFPTRPAWHRFWMILDFSPRHFERTRVVPTLRHSCVGPSPTDRDLPSASKDRRIFAKKDLVDMDLHFSTTLEKWWKHPRSLALKWHEYELKNLFRRVTAMWKGWRQSTRLKKQSHVLTPKRWYIVILLQSLFQNEVQCQGLRQDWTESVSRGWDYIDNNKHKWEMKIRDQNMSKWFKMMSVGEK